MAHRVSVRLECDERAILPLAGPSRTMRELARQVELLAQSDRAPALLVGESGTGKGWIAEHIHAESARSPYPFGTVNCATRDAATVAADLFGSSGSLDANENILRAARGGTILIEEISELSSELQTQLLRFIQSVDAAPDSPPASHPARIIAATSKDLVNEVNGGRFREDLYYQLSVTPLHLPPLRARSREDLSELIVAMFRVLAATISEAPRELGDGVTERLIGYPWPGNIRELRNVLERAMLSARGEPLLQRAHLPPELNDPNYPEEYVPRTITDVERAHIHRTLRAHKLNRTHAARELGISRATLIKKIKEYGLVYGGPAGA